MKKRRRRRRMIACEHALQGTLVTSLERPGELLLAGQTMLMKTITAIMIRTQKFLFVSSEYILPCPTALIESAVVSSLSQTVTVSWYRSALSRVVPHWRYNSDGLGRFMLRDYKSRTETDYSYRPNTIQMSSLTLVAMGRPKRSCP